MKTPWFLFGLVLGCDAASESKKVVASADTAPQPAETGSPETGRPDDTAASCEPPPWKTAVVGEPIDFGPGEGVDSTELEAAQTLAAAMLSDANTAAVFWRETGTDRYQVQTADGVFAFTHARNTEGDRVFAWEGDPPLNEALMTDLTLEAELAYGNPNGTSYPMQGYSADDPRLSFPEISETSYPRLMRRIAQIFAGSNGPDLGVAIAPWANGGVGSHGGMDIYQSRMPLVFRGPGVVPGAYAMSADHVDIAPTVAGLIGVAPVAGVDGMRGRHVDGQMLRWQDGRVLDEILVTDCAHGAASRAVVIILDGLNHTELLDGVAEGRTPNIARIVDGSAAVLSGGAIVGWPTFSLPGHTSVHTGAYQGHHGLLSNSFIDRSSGAAVPSVGLDEALADPVSGAAALNALLSPEVETIYEAVIRTDPDAIAANINELTFRGANWSRLVMKGPPPPGLDDYLEYALADETAVIQTGLLLEDVGPPKMLALSMYLTDGVGEGNGPHGDVLREAMAETDARIGRILDLYAAADAFEDTLWVLTADHGMAIQDAARTSDWASRASGTGVPYTAKARMLVLE